MRRVTFIMSLAVLLSGLQFVTNCSSRLDLTGSPGSGVPGIPGRVDTVIIVDTVMITVPDSSGSAVVCSRLSAGQQDIYWMFRNEAGLYHLEFSAAPEREHPAHTLYMEIDGEEYQWELSRSRELLLDIDLWQHATIRIGTSKPPAFGHAIDVCLTVSTP